MADAIRTAAQSVAAAAQQLQQRQDEDAAVDGGGGDLKQPSGRELFSEQARPCSCLKTRHVVAALQGGRCLLDM